MFHGTRNTRDFGVTLGQSEERPTEFGLLTWVTR